MIGYICGEILSIDNDPSREYIRFVIGMKTSLEAQNASKEENTIGYVILSARDFFTSTLTTNCVQAFWISNVVREDSNTLYGFMHDEDRKLFEQLISVSGIGPKIALAIFSKLSGEEIIEAVQKEDVAALSATSGLGKKGASKIILDLKGKLIMPEIAKDDTKSIDKTLSEESKISEILKKALTGLGFAKNEATEAVKAILDESKISENEKNLDISEYLRKTLVYLQKK